MSFIVLVLGYQDDGTRIRKHVNLTGIVFDKVTMPISIYVSPTLRAFCHTELSQINLSAVTVRSAFEQLEASHPALYRGVCDETGSVRRHVNVFVNSSLVRDREGLETKLNSGDVISLMPAVSGG